MKCLICQKEFSDAHGLRNHLLFIHKMKTEDYTLQYLYGNIWPTCKCGCGEKTRYSQFKFKQYKKGHNANRKGAVLSSETREKQSIVRSSFVENNPEWVIKTVKRLQETNQTPQAKKKRSDSRWSKEENHKKQSEAFKKMHANNPDMRIESTRKIRTWRQDNPEKAKEVYNEDWRNNISKGISNVYLSGGFEWSKGEYVSSKMNETYYYRSSWELIYMQKLDNDINVIEWKYEPFYIKYMKQDGNHRYLPDFLIKYSDGRTEIHEIGPKSLKEKYHQEKVDAAKKFCEEKEYEFKLIQLDNEDWISYSLDKKEDKKEMKKK